MNSEFKLIIKIKEYILALEDLFVSVPNRDYYNKQVMYKNLDEILYLIYLANSIRDKSVRKNYKYEILAKINMLNFYIERYHKLKYISKKQVYNNALKIEELTKIIYGWISSDDK